MTADVDEWIGPSRAVPAVGVAGLVGLVICIATGAYVVAIGAVVVTTFLMATTSPELGSPDETAEFSPEAIATNRAISARIETVGDWIPIQLTDDSNWDAGVVKLGGVLQGSLLSLSVRQGSTEVGTRKRPIAIAVISKSTNGFLNTSNSLPAFLRVDTRHAYDTKASLSDLIDWHLEWAGRHEHTPISPLNLTWDGKLTDRDRLRYAVRWPIFALKTKAIVG